MGPETETPRKNMGLETETSQKEHGTRQPDRKWHHIETPSPLWTKWLAHACENITSPQTSFAGGNELNPRNTLNMKYVYAISTNEAITCERNTLVHKFIVMIKLIRRRKLTLYHFVLNRDSEQALFAMNITTNYLKCWSCESHKLYNCFVVTETFLTNTLWWQWPKDNDYTVSKCHLYQCFNSTFKQISFTDQSTIVFSFLCKSKCFSNGCNKVKSRGIHWKPFYHSQTMLVPLPPPVLTSSDGHRSERYASFWNAVLFTFCYYSQIVKLTWLSCVNDTREVGQNRDN